MKNATTNAVSTPATNNAEFVIDTKITADGKVTVALNGKKMSLKKAIADLVEADAQIVKIRNEQGETLNYLFNDPFGLNRANLYFYWSFKTNFVDRIARGELDPKTGEPKSLTATTNTVEIDDEATETAATVETENTEVTDNKEETKMENATTNAVSTPAIETQTGTISINASAVGNGRVVVKVYGNHECAPAKLDDIAAEMPRLSDINIIVSDRRNFIAKGASYNGRYYAKANVYIFTNTSYGTADAKKMYKFDTAKEAVRKLARQELEDHIITAEELEILLAADREIERQREAKREAELAELDAEWAKYEHARHYAAKIALDSKSVNDNFRYCIYCAPQQPVQTALAESRDDDTDVFSLIPEADELNDIDDDDYAISEDAFNVALDAEIELAAKTDEPETVNLDGATEIGSDTVNFFNGKFLSVFSRKYHGAIVKTNGIISYCVFNDGDTEVYDVRAHEVSYDEFMHIMTERAEHLPDEPQPLTDGEIKADPLNATPKIEIAIGADATPAMIDIFEPHKFTLNTPAQILKLIEDTAGSPFSFDFESYFIKDDGGNKRKFITRHFVSECGGYGFIEIITEDGKLDHVEFVKHMFAQYKTVEFRLAAPAKVATDTNNKTAEAKAEVASNPHELIIGDEKITFESGHSGNVSSAKYGASFTYVGNRRGYFRVKFDGEDDSRIVTEHEFFKVMVNRGACKIEADTAEAKAEAENINTNHKEATQMANDNTEVRVTLSVKDYFDADKDAELLDELEHDIKWIDGIIRYRVDAAQGVFVTFSEPSTDAQVTALFNRYGLNYSRYVFREVKRETEPPTTDEMNAAIDRLVAEFDREQTEAERERKIAEAVADSMTAEAPHGWAVTFTDAGNYEVTAHGLSTATVDTITAGDYLNPKEFFAKFLHTQADIDDEREETLRRLEDEREQLLHMRDELIAEHPDEVERLMILDEMIADTDADIAAFESMVKLKPDKPIEFDKKGNVKNLWF